MNKFRDSYVGPSTNVFAVDVTAGKDTTLTAAGCAYMWLGGCG